MTSLRHNPYVGSFHGVNVNLDEEKRATSNVMIESKNNPLVGLFRHSPPSSNHIIKSKILGLKGVIYPVDNNTKSVINQLQIGRLSGTTNKRAFEINFLDTIKKIPSKVFSQSQSSEADSPICLESDIEYVNSPLCSICINSYLDGDELLTLACSHCFHNECISQWFYQSCIDRDDGMPFNCPECRQNHIFSDDVSTSNDKKCTVIEVSEKNDSITPQLESQTSNLPVRSPTPYSQMGSPTPGSVLDHDISQMSFLHIGETVSNEYGYDFLSDFGSEINDVTNKKSSINSPIKSKSNVHNVNKSVIRLGESQYSDCGTPL